MLFKREIKRNFKSFLVISLLCSLLSLYVISLTPSMGTDIQKILDLKLPKEFQTAIGISNLDFTQANSFYAICFSYIYLFVSIYISGVFAVIMSKEFNEKTAEFLFSLPIKHLKIIYIKLSVAFIYAFLTAVVICLFSLMGFKIFIKTDYEILPIVLMALCWFIGGITFGSLAFLISSFNNRSRKAFSISIGMVLFMYIIQVVISLNDRLEILKYLSPFDWFKGEEINNSGSISLIYVLIAIFISALALYTGSLRYMKKDVLI